MLLPCPPISSPLVTPIPFEELHVWLELVDLALSRARIGQKRAAIEQGITLEQWYQQRNGHGHVSLFRLFRLPACFWREFIVILAEHFGVALPVPDLVRALRRLVRQERAARAVVRGVTWRQGRLF